MPPERIVLLWDGDVLIGHATAYVRPVLLGDEEVTIGLIGDVGVDPRFHSADMRNVSFVKRMRCLPDSRCRSRCSLPTIPRAIGRRAIAT